jgi:hypothetical protein
MTKEEKQMTAQKKGAPEGGAAPQGAASQSADAKRKPWIKKTPVEIILEQVAKQKEKVEEMRKDLQKEEGELKKMQEATKLLGG